MEEQTVDNQVQQAPVNPVPVSKKPNHWMIAIIALAFLFFGLGSYYLFYSVKTPPPAPQPTVSPTSSPTTDETANWKTYKNDNLGFSIKYPTDYRMEEKIFSDKTVWVTLSSPDLTSQESGEDTFPKKGGEIRIEVYEDKFSIVKSAYALEPEYMPTLISSHATTLDNIKATYTIEEHLLGTKSHRVLAKKDNRQFTLQAFFAGGDERAIVGIFQKILSAFKFINQEDITPPQVCAQDAKLCSDGSYVSRQPPSCEFAKCP